MEALSRGDRLRLARKRKGYRSQTQLAAACGVDVRTVHDWESKSQLPASADLLAKLAGLLGVSMEWLVKGTEAAA